MPLTPSLRHCSNKYMLREGEKEKEKDEDLEKVKVFFIFYLFFNIFSSQVDLKEMSFQLLLEN